MASKPAKQAVETITPPLEPTPISPGLNIDIEEMIATELLDTLDWAKVKQALIDRARQRFWFWLSSQLLPTEQHQIALNEVEAIALASGGDTES